jgi:alkylated DNA repair dioxygenase AlkB
LNLGPGFEYQPGFIADGKATELLDTLWREIPWKNYEIKLFGRNIPQPRLTAWCCDPDVSYQYSGLALTPARWHQALDLLRDQLQLALGHQFNCVLANAYRNGDDAMGWHSDDEPELGGKPVIASVSLGASRRFLVRPKRKGRSRGIDLGHGSLLVMKDGSQTDSQHSVPRTKKVRGLRINLTYRLIKYSRTTRGRCSGVSL